MSKNDEHTGGTHVLNPEHADALADRILAGLQGEPGPESIAALLDAIGSVIASWECPDCRRYAAKFASKSLRVILIDALAHADACDRAMAERATSASRVQ
jgi:hypothetical protein